MDRHSGQSPADDPVARKTRCEPARAGGTTFRTRNILSERATRIVPTLGKRLFDGLVACNGAAALGNSIFLSPDTGFDRAPGTCWRGDARPSNRRLARNDASCGRLGHVHAGQVLAAMLGVPVWDATRAGGH